MFAAAVTGTNGKTTTVDYTRQLLTRAHRRAVSVSSLGTIDDSGTRPTPFFLSEPGCWRGHLDELAYEHDAAVIEAFSAGLSLGEWDGTALDAAALTTLGRDHLDVHGTPRRYAEAKLRLFRHGLARGGTAVVNTACSLADDVARIARSRRHTLVRYGRGGDVRCTRTQANGAGFDVTIEAFGHRYRQRVAVPSRFLADNALAALCIAVAGGVGVATAAEGLGWLVTPAGRMELVGRARGGRVYVDYAHSPDALKAALLAGRALTRRRLIVVFGCGGERDTAKRAEMGRVARRYADAVIVTDDNPRCEDPGAIRAAIRAGCPTALDIGDRHAAIAAGVDLVRRGDVLLICGMGADTTQQRSRRSRRWSDAGVVRRLGLRVSRCSTPRERRPSCPGD